MTESIVFRGQTFEAKILRQPRQVLTNVSFEKCTFKACAFAMMYGPPSERMVARNIRLDGCRAAGITNIGSAILDEIEIRSSKAFVFTLGAAFRHVRFSGPCGRFILRPLNQSQPAQDRAAFAAANAQFYIGGDWALDISAGEFEAMEIWDDIPVELIRRDPDTQMIARLSTVMATEPVWRKLDLDGTPWPLVFETMMETKKEAMVLVAPQRLKDFKSWLKGLKLLQREGIVDRD